MDMNQRATIPVGPPVSNPLPSYWTHPASPLSNVIEPSTTTSTTSSPYTHAIIGSGLSGTLITYNILTRDPRARIVLLDARSICSGATARNGGHTKAASYRTYGARKRELGRDEALKIARLEWENLRGMHGLAKELGLECESEVCNTVDIIYDAETFARGKDAIAELVADVEEAERGVGEMADYRVYEGAEAVEKKFFVQRANGNVTGEEVVGAFEYVAGKMHAYRFVTGVLKILVGKGLELCANTPVHAVRPAAETTEADPLWDVFTQYTTIRARNVVCATNGYTPYLLKELQGIIVPLRGQITVQKPPPTVRYPSVLPTTYSFIYGSGYEYMIPRKLPDGSQHIVIGGGLGRLPDEGTSEFGTVDDSCLNPEVSKYLRGTICGSFGPAASPSSTEQDDSSYEIVKEWTGIMGATADGRPLVGEVPKNRGLWISAGFNGHGMVLCLKAAEALVKMMTVQGNNAKGIDWFPESFLITEQRLKNAVFTGRKDMQVPETGEGSISI